MASENALQLGWVFGMNKEMVDGVVNLCDGERTAVFYAAGQTGVIYDSVARTQKLLQGHCNPISCAVASADKKWLATGDAGDESLLVVWDASTGLPARTLFAPFKNGVSAIDMSSDGVFLAALSAVDDENSEQKLAVWEWGSETNCETPVASATVPAIALKHRAQRGVRFNPSDVRELVTNNDAKVLFWSWGERAPPGTTAAEDSEENSENELVCYCPRVSKKYFRQKMGHFTRSCFFPGTGQAVTATIDGVVVLWEARPDQEAVVKGSDAVIEKTAVKVVKLEETSIDHVSTCAGFFVTAGADGCIRFYDYLFRIEAWFEDIAAGGVVSVSFAAESLPKNGGARQQLASSSLYNPRVVDTINMMPDFVVGTKNALIVAIRASTFSSPSPDDRRGTVVVQGFSDEITGLAAHPAASVVAIASASGTLYMWDYDLKLLKLARVFADTGPDLAHGHGTQSENNDKRVVPRNVAFDPTGTLLAVGFSDGGLRILQASTLADVHQYKPSTQKLVAAKFSPDGEWLAAVDAGHVVCVWKRGFASQGLVDTPGESNNNNGCSPGGSTAEEATSSSSPNNRKQNGATWLFVGRCRSHSDRVTGVEFGSYGKRLVLLTVADDRTLVEIDLTESSIETGLKVACSREIEDVAKPSALIWHPMLAGDFEERILTASSDLKFKQWNAENKLCRKTTLGPAFGGGPISNLAPLRKPQTPAPVAPKDDDDDDQPIAERGWTNPLGGALSEYLAYATTERVVGVVKMPLDGNPNKLAGVVAHPGPIAGLAASHCGRYLISAGTLDASVCLWELRCHVVDDTERLGGCGIDPYLPMLPGPRSEGDRGVYDDLVDYFYYLQLRRQGEDTTETRTRTGTITLADIPCLMRALGYYPSETEIANMVAEVRYSVFATTGETLQEIGLEDFVKLYVNHRPTSALNLEDVQAALAVAQKHMPDERPDDVCFDLDNLKTLLTTLADKMTLPELDVCLAALKNATDNADSSQGGGCSTKQLLTHTELIQDVLGFQEVDPDAFDAAGADIPAEDLGFGGLLACSTASA